jgi:hypothetical protein
MANNESESKQDGERPVIEPRRESFIIPSELMTDDQRRAARQTLELLAKIATYNRSPRVKHAEEPSKAATFLPHIDPERRNHVILIDGERGSGKTALLITLLHVLEQPILKQPLTPGTAELLEYLGDAKGRIVPLEHIDLLPLPKGTNLAMHLTSVLQKVVTAMEADAEPGYAATAAAPSERWGFSARRELKSRTQWRKLLKSVAAGREGNLSQRRAHVDPETYAFELEQAERERLDLDISFRAFVDALVADYKEWSGAKAEPLFVLSIDDADMNPSLCLELLDLIRTLWHPRVAFVLTGDSQTFLDVIHANLEGTLRAAGGVPELLTSRMRTLSQQIYDKTIPPSQRNELEALKTRERLPHVRALLQQPITLLRTTPQEEGHRTQLLLDLFELQPQLAEIFPDRLRALRDLTDLIQRQSQRTGDEWDRLRRVFEELWEAALRAPQVEHAVAGQFSELVQLDKRSRTFVVSTGPFTLRDVPQIIASGFTESDWRVYFVRPKRTDVITPDSKPLPRRLMAALLLAINTAQNVDVGLASFDEQHQTALGAQVQPRVEVSVLIPWPLPDFPTLLDHTLFGLAWEALLSRRFRLESTDVDALARRFLRTVCWFAKNRDEFLDAALDAVKAGKSPEDVAQQKLKHIKNGSESDSWEATTREVSSLTQEAVHRDWSKRFNSWAILSAGLLAAPESGVSGTGARELMEGLRRNMEPIWPSVRAGLRSRRLEHVARNAHWREEQAPPARRIAAERLLGQIDSLHPTHPWFTLIQGQEEPREARGTFNPRAVLSGVPVFINAHNSMHWMNSLADYVSEDRSKELGHLPSEMIPSWLAVVNDLASRGTPAALLHELWRIVTVGDETGLASLVNFDASTHTLQIDDVNNEPHLQRVAQINQKGSVFTFSHLKVGGGPGMSDHQYALYRIAWDFRADTEDLNTEYPPRYPGAYRIMWWGFAIRPANLQLDIFWPTIFWPALLDWELMFSGWRFTLNQMRARIYSAREEMLEYSVDHLGFAYLSNALAVFRRRAPILEIPSRELSSQDWAELWSILLDEANSLNSASARARAFNEWVEEARVMAAPESGLSMRAAEGILNALGELDQQTRKELRGLRRSHLIGHESSHQKIDSEGVILVIDRNWKEHPWVVRVEKPDLPEAVDEF